MTTTENMAEPTSCLWCDTTFDAAAQEVSCPSVWPLCDDCFYDHQRTCHDCGE